MIKEITLTNYRNLPSGQTIQLDPLTILVGANGSGKTNFIRVLRFLQDAWIGVEDERRGVSRFESAVARFGRGRILNKRNPFRTSVNIDTILNLQNGSLHQLALELWVKDENTVSVLGEAMHRKNARSSLEKLTYYDVDPFGSAIAVYQIEESKQSSHGISTTATRKKIDLLTVDTPPNNDLAVHGLQKWLEENSEIPAKDTPFFEGKRTIEEFIQEWAFYDASQMNIDAIRKANLEIGSGDQLLTPSGTNLALVLHNLSRDHLDFAERMRQAMTELFPETRELRTVVLGRFTPMVEWYLRGIQRPFFLDEMSEGTVRMLCWATLLFSPKIPRLLVIDEPEASLHPAWLRVLAGWIRDAARRTQIIVSTHSPDLLDYFTEDLASVRVFDKDRENPLYTTIRTIDPQAVKDKIEEGWRLGDLYRVGDPEIGGWPW